MAAEIAKVSIRDAGLSERGGEPVAAEMRIAC